jgi:hypothetical protein
LRGDVVRAAVETGGVIGQQEDLPSLKSGLASAVALAPSVAVWVAPAGPESALVA